MNIITRVLLLVVQTRTIQKLTKLFGETWYFWLYCIFLGFLTGRETDAAPMSRRVEFISNFTFAMLTACG